jgi:hypothetical protein
MYIVYCLLPVAYLEACLQRGNLAQVRGDTPSKNLANLAQVSGDTPSKNLANLAQVSGDTPSKNLANLAQVSGDTPSKNLANLAIPSSDENVSICDDTAHYLCCPILISIICDACHLEARPSLHDLIYGNGRHDSVGAVICATAFHVYHSCKLGNKALLTRAISSGNFSLLRASAHSSAKAFWNEYAIQAFRSRPCNSFSFARLRDSSHLGFLASSSEQATFAESLEA